VHNGKSRVRIARITTRLGVGGVERQVAALTANLDHNKYQNWLICGRAEKYERECLEVATDLGITPIVINRMRRQLGYWDIRAFFELYSILGRLEPEIVETHQSKAGALGRAAVRLRLGSQGCTTRLIHVFHGHQFHGYFAGPGTRAIISIERQLARMTDVIVAVTPTIRSELMSTYQIASADKIKVIPIGLDFAWINDLEKHRGWLRFRLGASDTTIVFGTVGRLTGIKNTPLLLRAMARMRQNEPRDVRLVIFGDGELRAVLESLVSKLKLTDVVYFAGWVLDRSKVFCDLDVTCLSSHSEGSPLCLIESIAAGVPAVATRVGGVADVMTSAEDGELVEAENVEAYASAMIRAAHRAGRLSRERSVAIREYYSIASLVKNYDNLYSEVLNSSEEHTRRRARRLAYNFVHTEQ
jgi:glycosyltransferase involved in cell wall biosynthesis